jgi:hypothetical protein
LTPVAAFDAARFAGAQLLDGVGSNHITATSDLVATDFQIRGVAGNSNPMALTTPIAFPGVGVVAGFWAPKRRNVLLTAAYNDTSSYALHLSDNGQGWYSQSGGAYAPYGLFGSIGTCYFVAMVTRGADSVLYVNGQLVGVPLPSQYTMAQIGQVGYGANGNEYNLDADELFYALGVWSGVASQANVQAIEAALRLELAGVQPSCRGFPGGMGRTNPSPIQARDAQGVRQRFHSHLARNTVLFDGLGQITATVKVSPGTPVRRRVVLIDEATRKTARETWSDAATGVYTFSNVDVGRTYTVLSYDHTLALRAVVADRVKPEAL